MSNFNINRKVFHPEYLNIQEQWTTLRTSFEGEVAVKEAADRYLPPTSGMIVDGWGTANSNSPGNRAYSAYKMRALYKNIFKETVQSHLGRMFSKQPTYELPTSIEYLLESATPTKEPLNILHQRLNQEQLVVGRVGILVDLAEQGGMPYMVTYSAESIIDWENTSVNGVLQLSYVCLDESGYQRNQEGKWEIVERFRILALIDGVYQTAITNFKQDEVFWVTPTAKGKPLTEIPFVIINTNDLALCPAQPPLIGQTNEVLSLYRQSADYYQALFMQAQPTLVRAGAESQDATERESARLGAGALVDIPMGATMEYVEVSGAGLAEMRAAMMDTEQSARSYSSRMLTDEGLNASGEALKVRIEASTVTLKNVAKTGADGLELALEFCTLFAGGQREEVEVLPNLDFSIQAVSASELKGLLEAKGIGAPISQESIYRYLSERDFSTLSYEEMMEEIAAESASPNDDSQ